MAPALPTGSSRADLALGLALVASVASCRAPEVAPGSVPIVELAPSGRTAPAPRATDATEATDAQGGLESSAAPAYVPPAPKKPGSAGPGAVGGATDRDGDGIPDLYDRCPSNAEDVDGFADADGCPEGDDDRDGVPDVADRCPTVPGLPPDGCPRASTPWRP
ncbi:MAG: thrombospondin type 3 repeat-containing protein [Polyangiaceae bacterium]|nr:thrombospondin type 3 repeat-containing protein [Polyangiaceae bacterium]